MRFGRRIRKHQLLVMRLDDMVMTHPDQDNSHVCSNCLHTVGIYPDGQEIIKKYGIENIVIICSECVGLESSELKEWRKNVLGRRNINE